MGPESSRKVTARETEILNRSGGYAWGLYTAIKEADLTLEEAFKKAISQPFQEEHHDGYTKARDYLIEHATELNIPLDED